jgi:hypothetical protein
MKPAQIETGEIPDGLRGPVLTLHAGDRVHIGRVAVVEVCAVEGGRVTLRTLAEPELAIARHARQRAPV